MDSAGELTSVQVRREQLHELRQIALDLSRAERRRVTLAGVVDRLLAAWAQTTSGEWVPLEERAVAVLDESGNGMAQLWPPEGERWLPAVVRVSCGGGREARCLTYAGSTYLGGTETGTSGDETDAIGGCVIARGSHLPDVHNIWSGGEPGAEAVLVVRGVKTVRS